MKKFATAALVAASLPSAAQADIHLDLGGYIRSYIAYADQGERVIAPGDNSLDTFRFTREIEMHFSGERTLENGVTVGIKSEFKLGNEGHDGVVNSITGGARDSNQFDEAYLYFTGGFGRFQIGAKDGAAHLLSVQAPAADTYVDGMRVYMQSWNIDTWDDGRDNGSFAPPNSTLRLGYDNSNFSNIDRITYLTPKWSGVQLGFSYAPENRQHVTDGAFEPAFPDDNAGGFEDAIDLAARWDTKLGDVKLALGAGYSFAGTEVEAAPGANGSDDFRTLTAGVNMAWREWSLGGAIKRSNTGVSGDSDQHIGVVGVAWDQKPWHLGATYYHLDLGANAFSIGLADDLEVTRITTGGWYQLTDGVTLRGTVSLLDVDNGANSGTDPKPLQVALGTEITF
ncbi:MAG TPA: porin [Patescibacteria group bacterium]|nr:porin [Patescibacteria group bacterium]